MGIEDKKPSRRDVLKQAAVASAIVGLGLGAREVLHEEKKHAKIERKPKQKNMPEKLEVQKDPFEQAFAKREQIDVGDGGVAEVVDVPPATPSDKEAVFLNPSWAVPINIYKYVIRDFAKAGRRTLCIDYARNGGSLEVRPEEAEFAKQFPTEQLRQALELVTALEAKGIEETAVVGHSQGGASAVIAATILARRAERGEGRNPIRNIVLFEAAGLIGKDTLVRLAKGIATDPSSQGKWGETMSAIPVSDEDRTRAEAEGRTIANYEAITETAEDKEGGAAVQGEQKKYMTANLGRTAMEVWGVSRVQVHDLLRELKEKHGVGIMVISDVDSRLFPTEKLVGTQNETTGQITSGTLKASDLDGFLSFRGDHALRVPQVPYIEGWLSALEAKQKRPKSGQ